jgi:hypothetical protein
MPRLDLPDGAQICYEILGSEHLTQTEPIVLITGMSSVRGDWDRLSRSLAAARPGTCSKTDDIGGLLIIRHQC